jgi:hypothetical protein
LGITRLGLTGTEYVALPEGALCRFVAGQPAATGPDGRLADTGTTAYLDPLPGAPGLGLIYYAQPDLAPWFAVDAMDERGFLPARALPTAELPAWTDPPAPGTGVPAGCFSGIAAADAAAAAWLERAVLGPARRDRITDAIDDGQPVHVVTPQGIRARVKAGRGGWDEFVVATFPGAPVEDLAFVDVSIGLRSTLQASELFLVAANADVFMGEASVRYLLDRNGLAELVRRGVPPEVVTALAALRDRPYDNEKAFKHDATPLAGGYLAEVLRVAGLLKASIDGWTFQLSPRAWRSEESPTVMLVKLSHRTLADLVADRAAWTWPAVAGDQKATGKALDDLIEAAAAAGADTPEGRFYREIVTNPRWTGVLFVNAPIAGADLPDEMRFVLAGVDEDRFFAHHVGFSFTPVQVANGVVIKGRTPAFGLIRYVDDRELAPETTVPFAFVTQRLEARFAGNAVAALSARVQLVVNELFGSRLTRLDPVGGNSLTLDGSYQRHGAVPGYRFSLHQPAVYATDGAALQSIEVLGVAVRARRGSADAATASVEFALDGNLRFAELPDFDLFSYGPQAAAPEGALPADGYLRYEDLIVTMTFPVDDPASASFVSSEDRIRVDVASSLARDGSLAAAFPVAVTGVVAVPAGAARPADLGYLPVLAPIDQVPLTPPWYGLTLRLDLGSLGPLANGGALSATLLAAWSPSSEIMTVYCGLKLPLAEGLDAGWPVQGVVRIGFGGAEFIVDRSAPDPAYLLRLSRLAVSVLGASFPPGRTDVLIFGDPQAKQSTTVGWYGAYDEGKPR